MCSGTTLRPAHVWDLWKNFKRPLGSWQARTLDSHPLGWQPAGIGDFDHDGTSDVAWYNPTTRNIDIWKIVNGHLER